MRLQQLVVAVLDDGIDRAAIPGLIRDVEIDPDGYPREASGPVSRFHGTISARIIASLAPEARYASVRIVDESGRRTAGRLVSGLAWAIDQGFPLIVASFGSLLVQYSADLALLVTSAYRRGIVLVAQGSDSAVRCYPASYEQVIGVRLSGSAKNKRGFVFRHDPADGIDIELSVFELEPLLRALNVLSAGVSAIESRPGKFPFCGRRKAGIPGEKDASGVFTYCNSFAASYMAGFIAREFVGSQLKPWSVRKMLFGKAASRRMSHDHGFPLEWFRGKYLVAGRQGNRVPWRALGHVSFVRLPDDGGMRETIKYVKEFAPALDGVILGSGCAHGKIIRSVFGESNPACKNLVSLFPVAHAGREAAFYNIWYPDSSLLPAFATRARAMKRMSKLPPLVFVSSDDVCNRISIAKALGMRFSGDGYVSLLVSADRYSPLYGFHCAGSLDRLVLFCEAYGANVVLFEGEPAWNGILGHVPDLHVWEERACVWRIRITESNDESIPPFTVRTLSEIGGLYKKILSVLAEEKT